MNFLDNLKDLFVYDSSAPLIFSSGQFLLLFLVFLTIYNLIYKRRTLVFSYIVVFSLFFYYKSSGFHLWILALNAVLSYYFGSFIVKSKTELRKKIMLALGIVPPLLLLAYFKYTNFFFSTINDIIGSNFVFEKIFLPVGISFFTFQSISYLIDVYKQKVEPADNLLDYSFYLTFFPQLVAGPIVKANLFLPQLKKTPDVSKDQAYSGLWLIILGLIKKAVIANYIAQFNDLIFKTPLNYSGLENLMAVFGYSLQIFCDFSGYSDMAIGIGKIMGYDLGVNFNSPYKSRNISEFWKRWHISLSSWLQEYLYIPLGGNREVSKFSVFAVPSVLVLCVAVTCPLTYTICAIACSVLGLWAYRTRNSILVVATLVGSTILAISLYFVSILSGIVLSLIVLTWVVVLFAPDTAKSVKRNINLILTMLIGGLWHGASWNFVFWGGAHGLALCVDKWIQKVLPKNGVTKFFMWFFTFLLVTFLWMFFRSKDIVVSTDAGDEIVNAFYVPFLMLQQIFGNFLPNNFNFSTYWDAEWLWLVLVFFGYACHSIPEKIASKIQNLFVKSNIIVKILVMLVVLQLVIQLDDATVQTFIYFDF